MAQPCIFILIGKSAAGKDTIYERLLKDPTLFLHPVVPYTTRPIRRGEQEGVEYHFVTQTQFLAMQAAGQVIESREYHTCYGPWYYFTADDGQLQQDGTSALMIGTLASCASIAAWSAARGGQDGNSAGGRAGNNAEGRDGNSTGDQTGNSIGGRVGNGAENHVGNRAGDKITAPRVVPLYIEVDDKVRRARAMAREASQEKPRYDEMERRFAADEEDFSEAKIAAAGITKRFDNTDLDQCVAALSAYIREQTH